MYKATKREVSQTARTPTDNTATRMSLRPQVLCAPLWTSWLPAGPSGVRSVCVVFSRVNCGSKGASNSGIRCVRPAMMLSRRRISSVLVSNCRRRNSISWCCTSTSLSVDASLDLSCSISDVSRYTWMRPSGSWSYSIVSRLIRLRMASCVTPSRVAACATVRRSSAKSYTRPVRFSPLCKCLTL